MTEGKKRSEESGGRRNKEGRMERRKKITETEMEE